MVLESYFDDSSDSRRSNLMRAAVYLEALISGIDSTSCGITKRTLSRNLLDPRTARVGTVNLGIGRNLKGMRLLESLLGASQGSGQDTASVYPYLLENNAKFAENDMLGFEGIEKLKTKKLFDTATGELVSHLIFGLIIAVGLLLVAAQRYIVNKRLRNKRWNNDAPS